MRQYGSGMVELYMRREKLTHIRPLRFHILRVWEDPWYVNQYDPIFAFAYLQQGRQWTGRTVAKDELDAYLIAKRGLKDGDFYLGNEYMREET